MVGELVLNVVEGKEFFTIIPFRWYKQVALKDELSEPLFFLKVY
jgi:hypothetical protein